MDFDDVMASVPEMVNGDVAKLVADGKTVEEALRDMACAYLSLALTLFGQLPVEKQALYMAYILGTMSPEQRARAMGLD